MICSKCNYNNEEELSKCRNCGEILYEEVSSKSWYVTLALCILLGFLGVHRFYVGKAGTAIIMLLTLGGFGIWILVDIITIILEEFKDEDNRRLVKNAELELVATDKEENI
ncbi:MAG: TM2 domain-containing protein [Clostridium argentinense]|uniref:TM2 domain-containing protein n=1 Tax=Clostridium faecium TaxID=2762223 RepID=A0ABR8YN50_9CLOT|nr:MULTISPECIES: TM2 domain-containing protein [Clostridium]MBD8045674.1 TM2 domain-containing protein [Clostridium faecium]MBS5823700.1 TM2 domain-containing protein [Clostridium argentinense]MDU1350496.1 TM2 domain-containing protein [Clostridium argentinense]